jgi:hypothetical protein
MGVNYTGNYMKNRSVFAALVLILLVQLNSRAAEKQYEPGKIVDLQQKMNTRILYYIADTPVTKDEPYYEVSVQSKSILYLGKYIPRHAGETLPVEWEPGATVDLRTDAHHFYLRKYSGVEIAFAVVKRTAIMQVESKPSPTPDGK